MELQPHPAIIIFFERQQENFIVIATTGDSFPTVLRQPIYYVSVNYFIIFSITKISLSPLDISKVMQFLFYFILILYMDKISYLSVYFFKFIFLVDKIEIFLYIHIYISLPIFLLHKLPNTLHICFQSFFMF